MNYGLKTMHLTLEMIDKHAVQSYSDTSIKVDSILYQQSCIVSEKILLDSWAIHALAELNETLLQPILQCEPEVIIIGHNATGTLPPLSVFNYLHQLKIGFECMSIGAAARTFNVLLNEKRKVAAGFIFP